MRKVVKLAEAVGRMPDGVILMIGGFMGASTPRLIDKLVRQGKSATSPSSRRTFPLLGGRACPFLAEPIPLYFRPLGPVGQRSKKLAITCEAMLQIVRAVTV
jgi:hypothetical protein